MPITLTSTTAGGRRGVPCRVLRLPPSATLSLRPGRRAHRRSHKTSASAPDGGGDGVLSPRVGDQVSQVATIIGSKHVEALTAITVELLQAALVGSASAASRNDLHSSSAAQSPEKVLEDIHTAVLAAQRDSVHLMGEDEREAWGKATWEVWHVVREALEGMLYQLHVLAADMGSATGASQAAECLASGLLVPRDEAAAFGWWQRASDMGSAAASIKVGLRYFRGDPPVGHDPAKAFECFSLALSQAEQALEAHQLRMKERDARFDTLSLAERDAAVGTDHDYLDLLREQRSTALTWLGRCYLEGEGVPRNVCEAARLFREAGNREELRELALLKEQFAGVDVSDVWPGPAAG